MDWPAFYPAPAPEGPPLMLVVVDTEEEFDWSRAFSRSETRVQNMREQWRAQSVFDALGVAPLYAIDYPVATDKAARDWLAGVAYDGRAEIGAHLHPWVTPPFTENVTAHNSYGCNLPADLEYEKLRVLTETITARFGRRPTAFKAGRYGFGPQTVRALTMLGYTLDLSVAPHSGFRKDGGPAFYGFPDQPFWFDHPGGLLEAPVTTGFSGAFQAMAPKAAALFDSRRANRLHIPGLLQRAGVAERIRLTPEHVDPAAHRRLLSAMIRRGRKVFTFSYHSSSLVIGGTPYVRSEQERNDFLRSLEQTLTAFTTEFGGRCVSASELETMLRGGCSAQAAE